MVSFFVVRDFNCRTIPNTFNNIKAEMYTFLPKQGHHNTIILADFNLNCKFKDKTEDNCMKGDSSP